MNEIWDGPGSMIKLSKMTNDMRMARLWDDEDDEPNLGKSAVD